jgi:fucose permease
MAASSAASKTGKNRAVIIRMVLLFIIIYATMFLFGLVENVKGVSFPLIKAEFGAQYDSQGGLVSMTWFGYVLFCLAASLFLHRFGTKKAVLAGYLLVAVGGIATLFAPSFWAAGLTLLVVNAGFGFFEVGANALATVVFTARAALLMNLMHFFYGFGAILGPKAAGVLTDSFNYSWRGVYTVILIPVALVFFFILFTRFTAQNGESSAAESPARVSFLTILRSPIVWMFCLTLGFMEVIEFGAANWGGLYLQDVYNQDPRVVGASFVSMFYILFTVSRLFSGLAIEKIGYVRSLYISLVGTIILLAVGFGLGEAGIWVLPFSGFFIAIMWPTIMAVAMNVFGSDSPAVTSVIITVSGAVNGVFQLVIGLTNQYAGPAWGYRSCLLYALLAIFLLYRLSKYIQQREAGAVLAAAV